MPSLAKQIVEHIKSGARDAEICAVLGCSEDYVRATRGRYGFATPLKSMKKTRLENHIRQLENALTDAKIRLYKMQQE